MNHVNVGNVTFGNDLPLAVIAGPCQLETLDHALGIAETMSRACAQAPRRTRSKQSTSMPAFVS